MKELQAGGATARKSVGWVFTTSDIFEYSLIPRELRVAVPCSFSEIMHNVTEWTKLSNTVTEFGCSRKLRNLQNVESRKGLKVQRLDDSDEVHQRQAAGRKPVVKRRVGEKLWPLCLESQSAADSPIRRTSSKA